MIKFGFKRPYGWATLGTTQVEKLKRQIVKDLQAGLRAMHQSIMNTPVYTGRTLVNYRWSTGAAIKETRAPVKQPRLPGVTSELALGQEPRRAAQAALLGTEFQAVLDSIARNPFQRIYLTNNTPYFTEVEYGTYKTSAGHTTRTPPGGMVRLGETLLQVNIVGLKKVGGDV